MYFFMVPVMRSFVLFVQCVSSFADSSQVYMNHLCRLREKEHTQQQRTAVYSLCYDAGSSVRITSLRPFWIRAAGFDSRRWRISYLPSLIPHEHLVIFAYLTTGLLFSVTSKCVTQISRRWDAEQSLQDQSDHLGSPFCAKTSGC